MNRVDARAAAGPLSGRRESYAERVDGPARPRIRWAWIAGCVVLGLAAIAAGRAIVPDEGRTVYVAGVLANVGTTLLIATASTRRSATSRSGSARAGDRWTRPKRAG